MLITKKNILKAISKMTISDILKLISMIEKKFNISSDCINRSVLDEKNIVEEKNEFDVFLKDIGSNKINVIKIVRNFMNLGLKESKDLVESTPVCLKKNIDKSSAESFKKLLIEAGASVELQ